MTDGMTTLEKNILRFEGARDELHAMVREAHAVLKDLRDERKEIEKLLSDDIKKMVNEKTDKVVRSELERIQPEIRKQTTLIYNKVGEQIDKLVNLSLGKEFSSKKRQKDLRPLLAARLRVVFEEVLQEVEDEAQEEATLPDGSGDLE